MTDLKMGVVPAAGCNCATCDLFVDNPEAVEPICSGSNADCAYCGCSRADAPALTLTVSGAGSPCGQCSVRCGSRTDIDAWMTDVGGSLEFDDLDMADLLLPDLPRFVPMIDQKGISALDAGLDWGAYGINLRRVFSPKTSAILPGWVDRTAAIGLGLKPHQKAVLVGYGEDPLVEAFWTNRAEAIAGIASQEWDLVLAPNFSMYGNYPRAEMLINFRRNLMIASEMLDAGIPAVPNIYWYRHEDLQRYERWLEDNTPDAVAVNLQTFRTDNDWNNTALPGLNYLAAVMPDETRLILTGTSRADRIGDLNGLFGERWNLVSANALLYARRGAVMTAEGRRDIHARTPDAFASSVKFYASLMGPSS